MPYRKVTHALAGSGRSWQGLRTAASVAALIAGVTMAGATAQAQESGQADARPVSQDGAGDYAYAPIVVTAQRRSEAQVDVPISVTTLSPDLLETSSVTALNDIARITPGLRFDSSGGGFFQPSIRGIGTAVTTSGGGGNVGIYVDGFYSPNPLATNMQLLKLQSIQVLKGPQGTLFGRNTTGGAILIQTAEPDTETAGEVNLRYGRYNEVRAQGYLTYGISDRVAMDFEGMYSRGDGYRRDISSGKRVGDYRNWSARIGLKAELSDTVSLLLRYNHEQVNDPNALLVNSYRGPDIASGAPFFAPPGSYTFDKNRIASGSVPEFWRSNIDVLQATLQADLGFADFTSYSQYRKEDVDSSIEVDYSGVDILQLGLPNDNETWSQEFLLNSKPGTPLQWTAGLFYFQNRDTYVTLIDSARVGLNNRPRLGGSSTTTKSYAAFVDATYEIVPRLFLTGGLRYAKDEVDDAYWNPSFLLGFDPTTRNYVPSISDGRVTPRFVVRYKPDDDTSVYASYTKGYKAAIIDVGGSCQIVQTNFRCNDVQPEKITAYEVGVKHDSRAVSLELSGFYYDYKNLQVSILRTGTAEIVNAAESEIYGIDGQVRLRVSSAFEVNAGGAWTHARYKRFPVAPVYLPCVPRNGVETCLASGSTFDIVPTNLTNVTMQRTPEFTGNLGARYTAELGGGELALSGNLYYSSKFFFGPSGVQLVQKGYETLALRAQWTDPSDKFMLAVWGDNVTNSRFMTGTQYSSFGIGANWNKPVTYGVEVGYKF